jgi:1-acyl-sn-glycerol-3-phosphate acyltransferase
VIDRLVRAAKISFYWTVKTIAWPVTHTYVRLSVRGGANVPRHSACIVAANHVSYVDATVLGGACPRRLTFMITLPIYSLWRLRWFYFMMGAIPVTPNAPDPAAIKAALRTLHKGGAIGIFPEGQRMPQGDLGQAKAGAALLAARTGAPVIPAAIVGAYRVMPVGAVFPRPYKMSVVFGQQIHFPAHKGRPTRAQLDAFADQLMRAIGDLQDRENGTSRAGSHRSGAARPAS